MSNPPPPEASGNPPPPPPPSGQPAAVAGETEGERALLHATEETRTYPCRACGGELEFDIENQMLACPHCGNRQELPEEDQVAEEQSFREAVAALRSGAAGRTQQQPAAQEKEVVCQNCGGHTTFDGSLTATRCPYCATPIQRDDVHAAPERLAVDGMVPFRVDEPTAQQAIGKWVKSRWFAPNEFKKYGRAGSFASVYMAFFTYDAETTTKYKGRRGDEYTVGTGDKKRTKVRWRNVSGQVRNSFDDIVVHANDGLDKRHVAALEPWPTQHALPYSAEYVAGHLCRTYDRDVEECFDEAKEVINKQVTKTIKRDIGGDRQKISKRKTKYNQLTYKHLLLPLWLLTVFFQGQTFQVMINGVTGEVQGARPWSKVKIALAITVLVVLLVVALVVMQGGSG